MKIEKEAQDFMDAKTKQFSQGLRDAVHNLDTYMFDNL